MLHSCVLHRPYESGEVNVQPYNTLLTLSHLSEVSDGIILTQNEVLHATCTKLLGLKTPSFAVSATQSRAVDCAGRGTRVIAVADLDERV